jgi:hypothetical protein
MRRESLRRHGVLDQVEGTQGAQLFKDARAEAKEESKYLTERRAKAMGQGQREETSAPRTENEGRLEEYRGRGALQKLKEEQARP